MPLEILNPADHVILIIDALRLRADDGDRAGQDYRNGQQHREPKVSVEKSRAFLPRPQGGRHRGPPPHPHQEAVRYIDPGGSCNPHHGRPRAGGGGGGGGGGGSPQRPAAPGQKGVGKKTAPLPPPPRGGGGGGGGGMS